jgi:hypothetical protein
LTELRKRRQELQVETIKALRKKELELSLKKIKQLEETKEEASKNRLSRSASVANSPSNSRFKQKQESDRVRYESLTQKLKDKGLYTIPARMVNSLYAIRAEQMRTKV